MREYDEGKREEGNEWERDRKQSRWKVTEQYY